MRRLAPKNELAEGRLGKSADLLSILLDSEHFDWSVWRWNEARLLYLDFTKVNDLPHSHPLCRRPQIIEQHGLRYKNFSALALFGSDVGNFVLEHQLPNRMLGKSTDLLVALLDDEHFDRSIRRW